MAASEPLPRTSHAAVGIGSKLYVWGGDSVDPSEISTRALESFDVPSLTWEHPRNLQGSDMPDGLRGMAVTSDGERAYCCSGSLTTNPRTRCNKLFEIDLVRSTFEEVQPTSPSHMAPKETSGSRAVYFQGKVVLFGGRTDQGPTNELYVFDLKTRVWATQPISGEQPPPLSSHTFTKIDHHRAVLFGGRNGNSTLRDTYVLDMETWHWTKLTCKIEPPARYHHAACCIAGPLTGQDHSLLMVVGGVVSGVGLAGDVWLLDVDNRVWSKVTLPVAITPRDGHSATMFGSGPSFRVVVLFGGEEHNHKPSYISETTLLLLELRGDSWQVTRVVKSDELDRPDESLREQMRKLELSPQEEHTDGHGVVTINLSDLHIGDKRLGKGGYGDVHDGQWKKMQVAIKVMRASATEKLLPEIKVWSSLSNHPNITIFFGVAYTKIVTYIVTELAVNGSLFDYLHVDKKTPSVSQSLAWALDIARGMKHLHDHDTIHRDLKSPNVLLSEGLVAKLCDFGCARELTQTVTTEQAGTYRWMSPEIMKAAKARINKKCDLFSYGMILFELFAHEVPHSDVDNEVAVLTNVMTGIRPPIPPTLPEYLHDLLKRCWEEDPQLRPTFDDFVNKIELPKAT